MYILHKGLISLVLCSYEVPVNMNWFDCERKSTFNRLTLFRGWVHSHITSISSLKNTHTCMVAHLIKNTRNVWVYLGENVKEAIHLSGFANSNKWWLTSPMYWWVCFIMFLSGTGALLKAGIEIPFGKWAVTHCLWNIVYCNLREPRLLSDRRMHQIMDWYMCSSYGLYTH